MKEQSSKDRWFTPENPSVPEGERWFAATLVFTSSIGDTRNLRPLCEERLVLFRASAKGDATAHAAKHGRREEHSYRNAAGQLVTWTFAGVDKVEDVMPEEGGAGWEVGNRYTRRGLKPILSMRRTLPAKPPRSRKA